MKPVEFLMGFLLSIIMINHMYIVKYICKCTPVLYGQGDLELHIRKNKLALSFSFCPYHCFNFI